MEPIQSRGFTDPDKQAAEAAAIALAEQHTDQVLHDYAARHDTYGGRYVCADTFKELMPGYEASRESRNALIRKAVSEWLAHQSQPQWPQAVLDFTGMADAPRFEAGRDRLKPPVDDPLA